MCLLREKLGVVDDGATTRIVAVRMAYGAEGASQELLLIDRLDMQWID